MTAAQQRFQNWLESQSTDELTKAIAPMGDGEMRSAISEELSRRRSRQSQRRPFGKTSVIPYV